ncbi:MAG: hypothetical protein KF780_02340 [Sphingomonas sp.]|nr:hypothetical protein [Sphingomonas sp.]
MSLKTPELRQSLKHFAIEALKCSEPDVGAMQFERFRLHNGVAFEISDEALQAQHLFVRKAINKLGPLKGHAKVLDKALWDFIISIKNHAQLDQIDFLNDALELIEAKSASVSEFFRPCPLVRLPTGVDRIVIGRVAIDRAEARLEEFRKINKQFKFVVGQDWSLSIILTSEEADIVTSLPPTMWAINLAAADPIREEEGLWLTDVALSLLRMAVKYEHLGPLAPALGKVEAHPFLPHDGRDHSFTLKQDGEAQLGGMTAPNDYRLTKEAADTLENHDIKKKIDKVFEAKPKSVAERFYQGCGWMTRGRRSVDRSDRLLYFFTAIESLLSDSDKTSPVIQTISRNAAVLLSDDNKNRQYISTDIRKLYGVRSALVHTGSRGAFDIDSNSAQRIVELIFLRVWEDIDLSLRHQDFSSLLGKASYGIPLSEVLAA